MRSIRQLLRQPLKTLAGVVLITLAVAVLCVCLGQSMAAERMERELETKFITTALPTSKYQYYEELAYSEEFQAEYTRRTLHPNKPDEITAMMLSLAEQYPDIVKSIHQPGLATAYIPELTAANYTEFVSTSVAADTSSALFNRMADAAPFGAPYTQIAARITLTEIGAPETYIYTPSFNGTAAMEPLRDVNGLEYISYYESRFSAQELEQAQAVSVTLTGTIDQVLGLQEGYADPTGFTARMTLILPDQAALEALELEPGGTYLVYGMDYYDLDWELRNRIFSEAYGIVSAEFGDAVSATSVEAFDPENLHMLSQENIDGYTFRYRQQNGGEYPPEYQVAYYYHKQTSEDGGSILRCINLTNQDMKKYRSVSFSLFNLSGLLEQVDESYAVPTITKLTGTTEQFLSSPEGDLWAQSLEHTEISSHSFAVMGVENLSAVGCFATQSAWISQGRSFTEAEIESGAKVCVLSEHLAALNGLTVGDTISAQYLNIDRSNPYQNFLSDGYGITNPGGYFYSPVTGFAGEAEEYTIVGLYAKDYLWPNSAGSLYAITPNTIFVPKASVSAQMDYATQGLFYTAVLHNGTQTDFEQLLSRLGEEGLFEVDDQGYAEVHGSLHNYQAVAKQALAVGGAVYSIILLLFLVLFPAMQGKVLATMGSLGAPRREKLRHMTATTLGILIPGTALGLMAGCACWQRVVDELTRSARVVLELELDIGSLALIAFGQLLPAAVLGFFVSLPLTREKGMKNGNSGLRGLFSRLGRTPLKGWNVTLFAAVLAGVLCGLNAANEAELADYEQAAQNTPVQVTLVTTKDQNAYDLGASGFVTDLFTDERFARFTPLKYVQNVQFMCSLKPAYINLPLEPNRLEFTGMTSGANPPELSDLRECVIRWADGYDHRVFDAQEQMYLLVPESLELRDIDPDTAGIQLRLIFSNPVMAGYYGPNEDGPQGTPKYEDRTCEIIAQVAGTYDNSVDSQTVFCSYAPLRTAGAAIQQSLPVDYISATLINNDEAGALREMANQWFADPNDSDSAINKDYALIIDTGVLENLKATLENSMTINRICTWLVFGLSAGAGFFLGFLMVRSRKREIMLMRTLGKPNSHIFRDFAWEQMRCVLLGAAAGGLVFLWQPIGHLAIFAAVYGAGLSLALVIFLGSRLLTNMKEEE